MKVFLDTNVLVSAFATRGLSADVLEVVSIEHDLITGSAVLDELRGVLSRKLKLSDARCAEVIDLIVSEALEVVQEARLAECAADEADRRVLGEAVAGGAEVFVTGDAALVDLERVAGMQIMTPRQFWEALQKA